MASFQDFKKLDIRIAQIKEAKAHPNADKLLVINIDIGAEQRQIVAGIKGSYNPQELINKKIVVITNLEPAAIRGVESQAMLLAAKDGETLSLLIPDKDVRAGSNVS